MRDDRMPGTPCVLTCSFTSAQRLVKQPVQIFEGKFLG